MSTTKLRTARSCMSLLAIPLVAAHLGCAPLRPSTGALSARPPRVAPAIDWLSKNPRGEFVLPANVLVHLTAFDGASSLTCIDGQGRERRIEAAGTRLTVDGRPITGTTSESSARAEIAGPVRIGSTRHEGALHIEMAPGGPAAESPAGGARLVVSARLPMERYIEGVVAAELPIWSAEPAELEAQAIAARTYAASALAKRSQSGAVATLSDGVMDQAYRGSYDGSLSKGAARVAAKLRSAVERTSGQVLVRGNRLEETRYHASCGGHTASFADVFAAEVRQFQARGSAGRPCPPCLARAREEQRAGAPDGARPLSWTIDLDAATLAQLGRAFELPGALAQIAPARRDAGGRWIDVVVAATPSASGATATTIPFDAVRRAAGYGVLKSALVDSVVWSDAGGSSAPGGRTLHLQGRGRGHGVGLCQEGARDWARAGRSSQEILAHYYPGSQLQRATTVERVQRQEPLAHADPVRQPLRNSLRQPLRRPLGQPSREHARKSLR